MQRKWMTCHTSDGSFQTRLLRLPTFLCVNFCLGEMCSVKAVAFSLSGLFLGVLSSVKAVE